MASFLLHRSLATRMSTSRRAATVQISTRNTSTSATYGISALSNRHETQHFHRLSRLPLMEHSPTLKLIHTSEVAPGASSAPSSSSSVDLLERQEGHAFGYLKQDGSAPDRANLEPMQGSKDIKNERVLPSVVSEYMKEIQGVNKRLDWHTTRLEELQRLVEKRAENVKSEPEIPLNNGRSPLKDGDDERGPISYLAKAVVYILTGAACYFAGRYQAESFYYEKQYHERQKQRNDPAPAPLSGCEYLNTENKAEIRVTVERVIDSVSDKSLRPDVGTEQSAATESSTQLRKPESSWSSLVWKKQ